MSKRIFIVEDNEDDFYFFQKILATKGYKSNEFDSEFRDHFQKYCDNQNNTVSDINNAKVYITEKINEFKPIDLFVLDFELEEDRISSCNSLKFLEDFILNNEVLENIPFEIVSVDVKEYHNILDSKGIDWLKKDNEWKNDNHQGTIWKNLFFNKIEKKMKKNNTVELNQIIEKIEQEGKNTSTKKVFVSYAWPNSEDLKFNSNHQKTVKKFVDNLRTQWGIDATFDLYEINNEPRFNVMMTKNFTESDKVIVINSPNYTSKANSFDEKKGAVIEYEFLISNFNKQKNKFIFLTFEDINKTIWPDFFTNVFTHSLETPELNDTSTNSIENLENLYNAINDIVINQKPNIGQNPPKFISNKIKEVDKENIASTNSFENSIGLGKIKNFIKEDPTFGEILFSENSLEKIIGDENDIIDVSKLKKLVECLMSVCRVTNSDREYGTGFIIEGGYLITNNHVIPTKKLAAETKIQFNYEKDKDGRLIEPEEYSLEPETMITSPDLDYTYIKIKDNDNRILNLGSLKIETFHRIKVDEKVTLIHHPNGDTKKYSTDKVISVWDNQLFYYADTEPGSSGGPILNSDLNVVGIHNQGDNEKGLKINEKGDLDYCNGGILISAIMDDIDNQKKQKI